MKRIDGVAVLIFALLALLAGCQPLPPVQDAAPAAQPVEPAPPTSKTPIPSGKLGLFQDAVHILHGKTVETFIRIEELEGKFAVMAIGVDDRLDMDSFTPVLEGRKLEILADLRFREAAADVMADYAALLSALSESQPQGPVDVAAERLAGSLGIFKNAAVPDGVGAAEVASLPDPAVVGGRRARPGAVSHVQRES